MSTDSTSLLHLMHRNRLGPAVYAAVLCLVVLAVSGTVGILWHLPWLFPSLGPTVMLFFESPKLAASRPLNALFGHAVALAAGTACLYGFGLQHLPSVTVAGLSPAHLAAAVLSVAATTFVLTAARMPHPPAGATTLIISLGILKTAPDILSMAGAVLLVTVLGWCVNLLLGTRPAPRTARNLPDHAH